MWEGPRPKGTTNQKGKPGFPWTYSSTTMGGMKFVNLTTPVVLSQLSVVSHPPPITQPIHRSWSHHSYQTSAIISAMASMASPSSSFPATRPLPVTLVGAPLPHSYTNSYPMGARQSESESARDGAAKHESNKSPNRKGPEEEEGTAHGRTTHLKPSWGIPFAGHSRRTGCSRCPPSSDSHP